MLLLFLQKMLLEILSLSIFHLSVCCSYYSYKYILWVSCILPDFLHDHTIIMISTKDYLLLMCWQSLYICQSITIMEHTGVIYSDMLYVMAARQRSTRKFLHNLFNPLNSRRYNFILTLVHTEVEFHNIRPLNIIADI